MTTHDKLMEELKQLRQAIDRSDRTPFGDMNRLLDSMAAYTDNAIKLARELSRDS